MNHIEMETVSAIEYEISSGNIFTDLELANPEQRQLKAYLAGTIYDTIQLRQWTEQKSASVLGIDMDDVTKLCNGMLQGFSLEHLLVFLSKLQQKITIQVQDESHSYAAEYFTLPATNLAKTMPEYENQ